MTMTWYKILHYLK